MSLYTTPIVLPHLPGSFTKPVRARKLLFSTFLTRNDRTTDESKKRLGMLSAGAIQFAPRKFYF